MGVRPLRPPPPHWIRASDVIMVISTYILAWKTLIQHRYNVVCPLICDCLFYTINQNIVKKSRIAQSKLEDERILFCYYRVPWWLGRWRPPRRNPSSTEAAQKKCIQKLPKEKQNHAWNQSKNSANSSRSLTSTRYVFKWIQFAWNCMPTDLKLVVQPKRNGDLYSNARLMYTNRVSNLFLS